MRIAEQKSNRRFSAQFGGKEISLFPLHPSSFFSPIMRLSLLAVVTVAVAFASCLLPFASSLPSSINARTSPQSVSLPSSSSVFPLFSDPRVEVHRVDENHYGLGPDTALNWAGYISVNQTRHLWYWFFESRQDPANDPFVLWMTGGVNK